MSAPIRAASAAASAGRNTNRLLLAIMFTGSAAAVGTYVQRQLSTESRAMDRYFAAYNTPESEASRRRTFEGYPDPRTNFLNFLSWK
ncbi:hypothetical protein AAL_02812 [Moelleriella libera RCEF 2490]|uniref:Uncharacterized protein n=1 Tax=Moelleriella libera RCEF 2490 TaxID=1081109 RepID=A0A168E0I0_9HYPO|nr:hypothetical protein AAL_02812 [Moelleriella libera RCEF 2490]